MSFISTEMFSGLLNLKYFRIERNRIICDCNIVDLNKDLQNKGIRTQIRCDSPPEYRGRNVHDISERDLICGIYQYFNFIYSQSNIV